MTHFTTLLKNAAYVIATVAALFLSDVSFGQKKQSPLAGPLRPNLGTASTYAIFTGGGAINNTGSTNLTGDVGQDGAYAFNGFPPGTYTGTLNRNNGASALAKSDLLTAWTVTAAVACDFVLGVGIVDGQSFDPAVYCSGAATTTSGNITFDAHGDGSAIFIVKIGGQLDANAGTHILLANNAQAGNIYWFVDGAVNIADNSTFKGVIFARGAIIFSGTSSLDGRALVAPGGAITLSSNSVGPFNSGPGNNLTVTRPAKGDSLQGGMQNYQITWNGTGINSTKIFEYSLDGGLTWKVIDTISADVFTHNWNVPDTSSTNAIVRVTDGNKLSGRSGIFTIKSSKPGPGSIIVIRPATGEIIAGGTQNYQITWTGTNISATKNFEYSLDGGLTWNYIGMLTGDQMTYTWVSVPNVETTQALIRITDANNATGTSGLFTITKTTGVGSIVVTHPLSDEVIAGGTPTFDITWTGANIATVKSFEYSLDGGLTWNFIGILTGDQMTYTWTNIPNVATTRALIRITDANGITGTSGFFTITYTPGVGSINSITLTGLDVMSNIGNNKQLGISYTFTPDIGTSVEVEYSLDYTVTWGHIATLQTTETPSTSWMTPPTGHYNPVFIRVTSSKGMTRMSGPFSIGPQAAVELTSEKNGYSVSNYPNPTSSQTTINFLLPAASDVTLRIIDGLGREVSTVVNEHFEAGNYNIPFDASKLSAGMYTYILQAGDTKLVGKMNIVK